MVVWYSHLLKDFPQLATLLRQTDDSQIDDDR